MYIDVVGLNGTYRAETKEIAKGGIGTIHRTTDPWFVYKQYLDPAKAPSRANLDQLVHIGRDVTINRGLAPGATPESSVNWPVDIVPGPGGTVRGVILPAIPAALFDPNFDKPRGMDFLLLRRTQPPKAKARVAILLRLAEILAYLDARGLVHGDINYKNVVWTAAPEPTAYLIDCDGLVPQNPPPAVGVLAAYWNDPRLTERLIGAHDHQSDWYALALAIYRGLTLEQGNITTKGADGTWPKPSKIPPNLDPQVAVLLHEALDDPLIANRPSPTRWVQALIHAFIPNGTYNDAALDALDTAATQKTSFVVLPQTNWAQTTGPQPSIPAGIPAANTQPQSLIQIATKTRRRNRRRASFIGSLAAAVCTGLVAWIFAPSGGSIPAAIGDKEAVANSPGVNPGSAGSSTSQPWATSSPSAGVTNAPINLAPPPAQPSVANPPPGVTPPAMPTSLAANAISPSTIRLQWSDNSADETSFNIYNGTTGTSVNVAANATTYNWGGLAAGTSMCFAIRASNLGGSSGYHPVSSPYYVCATTPSPPTPSPSNIATPPAMPSNLTAAPVNHWTIRVQWSDNSDNETGFTILSHYDNKLVTVGANTTSYDFGGLEAGTRMCFRVRADNSAGSSWWYPDTAPLYVCVNSSGVPAMVTNLTASVINATTVRLTWTDNSDNETGFWIYHYPGSEQTRYLGANTTSYTWTGLTTGVNTCFTVAAYNARGYQNQPSTPMVCAVPG